MTTATSSLQVSVPHSNVHKVRLGSYFSNPLFWWVFFVIPFIRNAFWTFVWPHESHLTHRHISLITVLQVLPGRATALVRWVVRNETVAIPNVLCSAVDAPQAAQNCRVEWHPPKDLTHRPPSPPSPTGSWPLDPNPPTWRNGFDSTRSRPLFCTTPKLSFSKVWIFFHP